MAWFLGKAGDAYEIRHIGHKINKPKFSGGRMVLRKKDDTILQVNGFKPNTRSELPPSVNHQICKQCGAPMPFDEDVCSHCGAYAYDGKAADENKNYDA